MLCFVRAVRCSQTGMSCTATWDGDVQSPSACLGSQCLRHWERWPIPARRRVAADVLSVRHARVDPELSGSLKSQGFRRQCEGFCQARAPFAASHPVSCSVSKVVVYSQIGCQGSAH